MRPVHYSFSNHVRPSYCFDPHGSKFSNVPTGVAVIVSWEKKKKKTKKKKKRENFEMEGQQMNPDPIKWN